MQSQLVFQEKKEMGRLRVQNDLLSSYELPVLSQLFAGKSNLTVLDIGCNDGSKTVERFSFDAVSKVVGVERIRTLTEKAQEEYTSDKYAFYTCDVEAEDFSERLHGYMRSNGIDRFGVIYLSLVLMHLKDPAALLRRLHSVLVPGGSLIVLEANDRASKLPQESMHLLTCFLDMLQNDPYAGNRSVGPSLPELTTACGYQDPVVWFDAVEALPGEQQKKETIFQTLFSYFPDDIKLLRQKDPQNQEYAQWEQWLDQHFDGLRQAILREDTPVAMGVRLFSCRRDLV